MIMTPGLFDFDRRVIQHRVTLHVSQISRNALKYHFPDQQHLSLLLLSSLPYVNFRKILDQIFGLAKYTLQIILKHFTYS